MTDPRVRPLFDSEQPPSDRRRVLAAPGWLRSLVARLIGPARLIPGLAAVGCAVAGSWLLWGVGVALLVAVPFLLLIDARTPRG